MSLPSSRSVVLSTLTLAVCFTITASSLSVGPSRGIGEKQSIAERKRAAKERGWKAPARHHVESPEWQTLSASYYDTRGQWSSKLTLNNKGRDAARPEVTLFNPQGRPHIVPDVIVPGAGFLEIDLTRAARRAGGGFATGSVRVKYLGNKLEMGAQVLVQDLDHGLQFDEQLSYSTTSYENRLEGLWWRPNDGARMSIVMTNLSDEPIEVRGRVKGPERGGHPEGAPARFRLDPHEQRIVAFQGEGGGRLRDGDTAGGVSLEFDGPHGALLARVLVEDAQNGYSASLALSPTTGAKTSTYHGGGLRRSSADVRLLPVLLGRNLSDASSVLTGRLVFNRPDGTVDRIALPLTTLEAGETALIDAREAWRTVQDQAGDDGIGVEFEYTSAPGSVLMSAGLVSGDRNLAFRVPLIDPETPKSSTGGYPWFADDERTTTVFLKNTTTTKLIYLLQISHPAGIYAPGIKEIEPGQTIALDVRRLRDEQVPDAFGKTIPSGATGGQVSWSIKSTTKYAMIGRAEHTDQLHGVSASYACLSCCPPRTYAVWMQNDPSEVDFGGTTDLFVMAQDEDCYDNIGAEYSMPWPYLNSWSFGDTGIATSYSDSTVYGVNGGETTFYFSFPGVSYHVEGTEYGWYCHLDEAALPDQGPVIVQQPTLTVSASSVTRGQSATFTVTAPQGATISDWEFVTNGAGTVTRQSSTGSSTWQGAIWAPGEARVKVTLSGQQQPVQLSRSISVNPRNLSWNAVSAQKVGNGTIYTFPGSPTPPTLGYFGVDFNFNVSTQAVSDNGPNQGVKYVQNVTASTHSFRWQIAPWLDDTQSEFYAKNCGQSGFISGATLKSNTIEHDSGTTLGHYRQYSTAIGNSSNNPGDIAEEMLASPSTSTQSLANSATTAVQNGVNAIVSATGSHSACNSDVRYNTSCQFGGNINYPPYQACGLPEQSDASLNPLFALRVGPERQPSRAAARPDETTADHRSRRR